MVTPASDYVNIVEHVVSSKSEKGHSEKEIAVIAFAAIRKNGSRNRSEIVQALVTLGFNEIESSEALRYLEDNKEIFLEDSSFLKVVLYRNILPSEFERQQKQLQNAWLKAREEGCFF